MANNGQYLQGGKTEWQKSSKRETSHRKREEHLISQCTSLKRKRINKVLFKILCEESSIMQSHGTRAVAFICCLLRLCNINKCHSSKHGKNQPSIPWQCCIFCWYDINPKWNWRNLELSEKKKRFNTINQTVFPIWQPELSLAPSHMSKPIPRTRKSNTFSFYLGSKHPWRTIHKTKWNRKYLFPRTTLSKLSTNKQSSSNQKGITILKTSHFWEKQGKL